MTVLERAGEVEHASTVGSPAAVYPADTVRPEGIFPDTVDPRAIFPEARRRARLRRATACLTAIAAAALVALIVVVLGHVRTVSRGAHRPLVRAQGEPGKRSAELVAWGDYAGVLHLGDVATHRQLQIATLPVAQSPAAPEAFDRGRLLWVDARNRVRSLVIATGRMKVVARGTGVMTSPAGDRIYVDQGTRDFLELNARTLRVSQRDAIPAGWTSDPWVARPIAGALVLRHTGAPTILGIWRPGGSVRPLGKTTGAVLDVYTAPTGRYGLVAWQPVCARHAAPATHCPLAITNTRTGRAVMIPSPTHFGFTGGAFSPDGTRLAIYVNTNNPSDPLSTPHSELAIVDTRTGALRLDPEVNLTTTEDAAWATWLRSGRQLLTGAIAATYLVDTRSLATRAFYFDGAATRTDSIMNSGDLNFSTIVVPPSALSVKQRRSLARGSRAHG